MTITPLRVYYEHTDAGGIVYHANYLGFCERGRTELLRALGFENTSLRDRDGMLFVVRHIAADYLAPAFLDDLLDVHTSIKELGRTRIVMKQSVQRGDKILFAMDVTLVCINLEGKPIRPPDHLIQAFTRNMEQSANG
jgi:acyl-CoA thioester hydrolase